MVSEKAKITASVGSALLVGVIHYGAHMFFPTILEASMVTNAVGITVVLSVAVIGYLGMTFGG